MITKGPDYEELRRELWDTISPDTIARQAALLRKHTRGRLIFVISCEIINIAIWIILIAKSSMFVDNGTLIYLPLLWLCMFIFAIALAYADHYAGKQIDRDREILQLMIVLFTEKIYETIKELDDNDISPPT